MALTIQPSFMGSNITNQLRVAVLNNKTYNFGVVIVDIQDSEGNSIPNSKTPADVAELNAQVNALYNKANITIDMQYIRNCTVVIDGNDAKFTLFAEPLQEDFHAEAESLISDPDCRGNSFSPVTIWLIDHTINQGMVGITEQLGGNWTMIFTDLVSSDEKTTAHEIGHIFGLMHRSSTDDAPNEGIDDDPDNVMNQGGSGLLQGKVLRRGQWNTIRENQPF